MLRERKDPVDTAFYDFYRQLPLNDPRTLGINNHRFLINRLEFCPVYRDRQFSTLRFSYLVRAGFSIEADDLCRIDSLERKLYTVPGDSAAMAQAYSRAWGILFDKYEMFFNLWNTVGDNGQTYALEDAYWGRPMPFLNDLIASRRLHSNMKRLSENIPNRWLAVILSRFTTPYVIGTIGSQ